MPLSISCGHSKRGNDDTIVASSTSKATHDRAKIPHKMVLPSDFYRNIWGPTEAQDAALRRRARSTKCRPFPASTTSRKFKKRVATSHLVDIAQVAHVVTTTLDFRADYGEATQRGRRVNIWDERSLALGLEARVSTPIEPGRSKAQRPLTTDTEPATTMSPLGCRPDRITELSGGDCEEETRHRPRELKHGNQLEVVLPHYTKAYARGDQLLRKERNLTTRPVPPPSSQNGSLVFSAIFSNPREWSWSTKFLLGLHEPIRHALFVMDRFLDQSQSQSKPVAASHTVALESHVAEFFVWFKTFFVEYLLCQHEVKAAVLLPMLNLPAQTKHEILDEYQTIKQLLAQIQQLERALCVSGACSASAWLLRLQVLQTEIRQLNRTLQVALNREETTLNAAMNAAFTERAFRCHIMPRIFRAIRAKRVVVPWIVERSKVWGGDTEQRSLQSMLPFSAKFMYCKVWRPFFMSNVAVAMKNLNHFDSSTDSNSSSSSSSSTTCSERQGELCSVM